MRYLMLVLLILLGCSEVGVRLSSTTPSNVATTSIHFPDTGLESLNTQCPVTGQKLNLAIEPI